MRILFSLVESFIVFMVMVAGIVAAGVAVVTGSGAVLSAGGILLGGDSLLGVVVGLVVCASSSVIATGCFQLTKELGTSESAIPDERQLQQPLEFLSKQAEIVASPPERQGPLKWIGSTWKTGLAVSFGLFVCGLIWKLI